MGIAWEKQLGSSTMWTDFAVLQRGSELRPALLGFIALSGALAFGYNALTAFLVVRLSATTTSLIGNIPTSTVISLLILERRLPHGVWGVLFWAGVVGNVAAFAAYGIARRRHRALG